MEDIINSQFKAEDGFFVITPDHLDEVRTQLFGYCVVDDELITDAGQLKDSSRLSGEGAYVYIESGNGQITVYQDFMGCYGLYLYKTNDYWALSNSFIYLVDHIKHTHTITFNKAYADAIAFSGLCSHIYGETLIREITWLDKSATIEIDTDTHAIRTILHDRMEFSVDLDSAQGMALLDNWYFKWTSRIRSIKKITNNITTDLSGGMDSRMVFNLFLGSGINCDEIRVASINDGLHTHAEDFAVAQSIADHYGFHLNNDLAETAPPTHRTGHGSTEPFFVSELGIS